MRAAVDVTGASLPRTGSQVARHVSFRYSSSSEAASEAASLLHPTKAVRGTPPLLTTAKKAAAAKTEGTHPSSAAASHNATRRHAPSVSDPRQWILALGQLNTSDDSTAARAAADGAGKPNNDRDEGGRADRCGDERDAPSGSDCVATPLEERIGLPELKLIMQAFRQSSACLPVAAAAEPEHVTQSRAPPQRGPYFVSHDDQSVMGETVRYVEELSSTVAELLGTERDVAQLCGKSCDDVLGGDRHENVCPPASSSSSAPVAAAQLRNLSRAEFTQVLRHAVPSATLPEIRALLAKAISDTQDTVSWNELATFLVTCSRQKADLAMEDQRFVLAGRPANLHFEEQHSESITCVAVNKQRRLIVTGCSSGSVRAWSSGADLAYRGMLLKVEGWIVGLHWGCRSRVLYVTTMDRSVYVLEGTTYEVLRVFHGRSIKGTADSVTYATETLGKMLIGGVALPKHRSANERGYAGARLPMPSSHPKDKKPSSAMRTRVESGEDRMQRLLSSAMQVRRGVQHGTGDNAPAAAAAAAPAAAATTASGAATPAVEETRDTEHAPSFDASASNAAALTTSYSLTTASAADALHQDSAPLTGAGRGPYVVQHVDEGVLASLVDGVSATAFEESAFQEDVLLLGTSAGDAFLFVLAQQYDLTQRRVLVARHVFAQLHHGLITKLEFSHPMNALISAGEDGRVRVTSLVSGQNIRTFYAPELPEQHASVTDFAVHPQLKMLLTIGPERRALVWEWNQPSPIAVLEPVNRPLCCGAFLGEQLLTVSRDRVMHVYDCKSFRLRQELPLGFAGSLTRFSGATASASPSASAASSWTLSQLHVDPVRQRVLGFGRFPFALCVKRQVSSGCPVRYRGHHAPMFATLTSRAFGQVVTVGTDGVVMTWTPRTGVNEFSFLLSNFSNASATSGAPVTPVTVSMDVLQRRLLTGFPGGVVVAWNVLNGQVERVLTAAAATGPAASSPTSATSSHSAPAAPAPKRDVTAVGSFLRYRAVSYLFAVGRVLYVDAAPANSANGGVFSENGPPCAPQLGEYTTTFPSAWTPQAAYGDFTQLLQLSPQHVACGTTSGAVLVYNVLSDGQEGAPLWVKEAMLYPPMYGAASVNFSPSSTWRGSQRGRSVSSRHGAANNNSNFGGNGEEGTARMAGMINSDDVGAGGMGHRGNVVARTIRMLELPAIHPRLLVVAQEDGTLSLWHTLRRVCIGAVNLTAVGLEEEDAEEGEDGHDVLADTNTRDDGPSGSFVFDMDGDDGELLVFGDGEGNVHVCRLSWQVLTASADQVAAISLPNPLLYTRTTSDFASKGVAVPLSPRKQGDKAGQEEEKGEGQGDEKEPSEPTGPTTPDFNEAQRSVPLLRQLERVHVFSSGLVLAGLRIVDAGATTSLDPAGAATVPSAKDKAEVAARDVNGSGNGQPPGRFPHAAASIPANGAPPPRSLVIVCTGADHYVRVFSLAGVPIGELGMDEWVVNDPRTFRFMGESMGVPAAPLPCSIQGNPNWQRDPKAVVEASPCFFNYLADLHAVHNTRVALFSAGSRSGTRHGRVSMMTSAQSTRSRTAATGDRASHAFQLDALVFGSIERVHTPSATQRSASPSERKHHSLSPERRFTALQQAASVANAELAAEGRLALFDGTAQIAGAGERAEEAGEETGPACKSPTNAAATRSLSTRLRRSTRYRYSGSASRSLGVVKPSCARAAVRRAASSSARQQPYSVNGGKSSSSPAAPVSPLADEGVEWVEQDWSATSLPSEQLLAMSYAMTSPQKLSSSAADAAGEEPLAQASRTGLFRGSYGSSGGGAALRIGAERCESASACRGGSASTRRPRSPQSTLREPLRKPGEYSSFSVAGEEQQHTGTSLRSGGGGAADGAGLQSHDSPLPTAPSACAHSPSAATLTSPERRPRSLLPNISSPTSAAFDRSTSPSSMTAAVSHSRDTRHLAASPVVQRSVSLQTPSMPVAQNAESADDTEQRGSSDMSVFALLSRERKRLTESTRTSGARDQLSALAMPVLSPTQNAATARSSGKAEARLQTSTAVPGGSVQQHVDALLEKRRTQQVCGGVSPEVKMRKSAEGFVAHMTSQLYVAPLQEPRAPGLTMRGGESSSVSLPARSRSRPRPHY